MYRVRTSLCIVAFTLTGCSGELLTSPATRSLMSPASARDRRSAQPVPMAGQCALTVSSTVPFPAPPLFRQVASGTCDLTHLGRAAIHFVQVVDFATGTQHSLELTYTAANGDVLRAESVGTSVVEGGTAHFEATINFVGGTGRFANASGQARAVGDAELAAGTSRYTLDGSIEYDASDRRQ